MIIVLPSWYSEAEAELDRAIHAIAARYNLKTCFVMDSKAIDSAKDTILQAMVSIYQNASGQFTQEELNDFKQIEEALAKENQEKHGKSKNKNARNKANNPSKKKM